MADPKRSLDIETALRWAFRDELPKVSALNRDEVDAPRAGDRGRAPKDFVTDVQLMIDMPTNCFGVVKAIGSRGSPHPDAILIGDAVAGLDGMVMGVPESWKPLAEMDDLSPEVTRLVQVAVDGIAGEVEGGRRLFGMRPSFVVQRYAQSGGAPDWRAEVPAVKVVSAFGKPSWFVMRRTWSKSVDGRDIAHEVEEDGYNARSKRPYGDAYRKIYLAPDPTPAIRARAEYEVWHAALDALVEDLASCLATIRLSPTRRTARPWIWDGDAPSVLPSLVDMGPLEPCNAGGRFPGPTRLAERRSAGPTPKFGRHA